MTKTLACLRKILLSYFALIYDWYHVVRKRRKEFENIDRDCDIKDILPLLEFVIY